MHGDFLDHVPGLGLGTIGYLCIASLDCILATLVKGYRCCYNPDRIGPGTGAGQYTTG